MILSLAENLGVWGWFVLGAVLLGVEIVAPGTFLLWIAFAAFAVGLLTLVIDWGWQAQWLAFAVLSLAAVVAWWRFFRGRDGGIMSDRPMLNRRAARHVGREFLLEEPVVQGTGRIRIDDTMWRVLGPDCSAGTRVRVVKADGANLLIEPVQP